jgi:type IV secretory pathway VirB3-like protein
VTALVYEVVFSTWQLLLLLMLFVVVHVLVARDVRRRERLLRVRSRRLEQWENELRNEAASRMLGPHWKDGR